MLKTVNVDFRDCSADDFRRYFNNCLMLFRVSPEKQRIAVIRGVPEETSIALRYLTIKKEWKDKLIPFVGWYDSLVAIPHMEFWFNTTKGCCIWTPETNRVMFKSLVNNLGGLHSYGLKTPEDQTLQRIMFHAFEEFYHPVRYYSFREVLILEGRHATVSRTGFVLDHDSKEIFYKRRLIGVFDKDGDKKILLFKRFEPFVHMLTSMEEINRDSIVVQ